MTKLSKMDNRRIERAVGAALIGNPISMIDIPKAYKAGEAAVRSGADDYGLQYAVRSYVESVRVNVVGE